MKYIGSGLWAIAGAYLSGAHGGGVDTAAFVVIALGILFFGKNRSTVVQVNNNFTGGEE